MKKILVLASVAAMLVGCNKEGGDSTSGRKMNEPSGAESMHTNMNTNASGSKVNEPSGASTPANPSAAPSGPGSSGSSSSDTSKP